MAKDSGTRGHILKLGSNETRAKGQGPHDGSSADREWKLLCLRGALHKCCHLLVHKSRSGCSREDALLTVNTFACLLELAT
jgi:hypothetical protein